MEKKFGNHNKRSASWNYGGSNWKLSRSKIDAFRECPRCFYLDNKLGVRKPSMIPFNLNNAVDTLLKKEFDKYRKDQKPHPLMKQYKIDAVPFQHKELDQWRENFVGVQVVHEPTGMTISGAVDDIWVNPKGEIIVVDYKSTSKDVEITLDDEWKDGYKRQMDIYQWLLRQKGFEVSEIGYFVYANASTSPEAFNGRLEFDVTILPYEGDTSWVDNTISQIHEVLEKDELPDSDPDCEYCACCNLKKEAEDPS
jgi:CRISPR/Cas system-associated exonuclease Cas4 (RecB family)